MKGDWHEINIHEVFTTMGITASLGLVRFVYLIRKGRRFTWFDMFLEPCLAVFAGLLVWGITEVSNMPDILQQVFAALGSWGAPKTIAFLETKYFGNKKPGEDGLLAAQPGDSGGE